MSSRCHNGSFHSMWDSIMLQFAGLIYLVGVFSIDWLEVCVRVVGSCT